MASCMLSCPGLVPGTGSAPKCWVAAGMALPALMAFSLATSSTQRLFSGLLPACPLLSGAFIFSSFYFVLDVLCVTVRIWIVPAMFCDSFWQGCCISILLLGRMSSTGPCLLEHGTRSRQRHLQDSKIASLAKVVRAIARETY